VEQFLSSSEFPPSKTPRSKTGLKGPRSSKPVRASKTQSAPTLPTATIEDPVAEKAPVSHEVSKLEAGDLGLSLDIGELVFARCTGHPWWPGMVVRIPTPNDPERYQIMFFDVDKTTTAFVKRNRIKTFARCPEDEKKTKMTPKQVSIGLARPWHSVGY